MCKWYKYTGLFILGMFMWTPVMAQSLKVVTSTSFLKDIALQLAPPGVEVQSIVPLGGDPHIYDATPSDAQLAAKADLILVNGLTLEGWISELIDNSGTTAKKVRTSEGVDVIQSMEYQNASDPHAWMDLKNGRIYAKNIANALIEMLPGQSDYIQAKLDNYLTEIDTLDQWIRKKILEIPEKHRILITSHDAFQYYGRAYGLQLESVLGTSTDADVQTKDIVRLGQVIQDSQVPAIFLESTLNPKLLRQIGKDNNVRIGGELYADSLGPEDSQAGTYLGMLRYDTKIIVQGLKGEQETHEEDERNPITYWLAYGLIALIMIGLFITAYYKLS